MAAAYLDPNLNHALNQGVKPRFSGGMERATGAMERVLKVFHYFESSSEPCTWASNIRHGDSTDIKVRGGCPFIKNCFTYFKIALHQHVKTNND